MFKRLFTNTRVGFFPLFALWLVLWPPASVLAQPPGSPYQLKVTGTCAPGSSIRVINADGSVVCEADDNSGGTVTSVGTGSGLTGGPITTIGTISIAPGGVTSAHIADGTVGAVDVNPAQIQLRVTDSCAPGSAIQAVNQSGTVICQTVESGTVKAVTASAPLFSSGGTTPNVSLPYVVIETAGNINTAIGGSVLSSNTTGSRNTASGFFALSDNTVGFGNTASGVGALRSNTTGSNNTAIGDSALYINTTGSDNTAIGVGALENNRIGLGNTAAGSRALESNTIGNGNTASGANALLNNTTSSGNTASGANALLSNTTGGGNTASGASALQANTTGFANTASGHSALISNTTGDGNTAIGDSALLNNTTSSGNTASGFGALSNNTTGSNNTASGVGALQRNTTGVGNTAIGSGANVSAGDLTNATAIGTNAFVDASNKIRLGNPFITVIEGEVPFTASSDATKKENFQTVDGEGVLKKINGFTLTSWNFIGHDPSQFRHYGPTAQEFFAAFGSDGIGTIGTPTTINSGDMAGILMIAVQALERRTAEQKSVIEMLRAENAALQGRLEALEISVQVREAVAQR